MNNVYHCDLSIIIINYKTFELAKAAIESIFAFTKQIRYEVIVVDNASPDNSGEKLRDYFNDRICYYQYGSNGGTSKAFNFGTKKCSGKYIIWLNPDVLLEDDSLSIMFNYLEEHPECGICGSNLLGFDHTPTHSFKRKIPSKKSLCRETKFYYLVAKRLFQKFYSFEYNVSKKPLEVGYVTGADMMVRSEIVEQLNGFLEDIFMYYEEVEFTFRMLKNTDYKVMCIPNAHILHLEGGSYGRKTKVFSEWQFGVNLKSLYIYMNRCYNDKDFYSVVKAMKKKYIKGKIVGSLLNKKQLVIDCQKRIDILDDFVNKIK